MYQFTPKPSITQSDVMSAKSDELSSPEPPVSRNAKRHTQYIRKKKTRASDKLKKVLKQISECMFSTTYRGSPKLTTLRRASRQPSAQGASSSQAWSVYASLPLSKPNFRLIFTPLTHPLAASAEIQSYYDNGDAHLVQLYAWNEEARATASLEQMDLEEVTLADTKGKGKARVVHADGQTVITVNDSDDEGTIKPTLRLSAELPPADAEPLEHLIRMGEWYPGQKAEQKALLVAMGVEEDDEEDEEGEKDEEEDGDVEEEDDEDQEGGRRREGRRAKTKRRMRRMRTRT